MTFVFDGLEYNLVSSHQEGCLSTDNFNMCLVKCQLAAKDVVNFYRQTVEKKYKIDLG